MFKRSFIPGSILLIIITTLLCLPGSALPHGGWLDKIPADKIVHVGLFCTLFLLWVWPLRRRDIPRAGLRVFIVAIGYGIAMEFVQHFFIPNRSFEIADMFADAGGLLLGAIVSKWWT